MTEISVSLQGVVPQHGLSRLVGWLAELRRPVWLKNALIRGFCRVYDIDLTDAEGDDAADWPNFNAFFTRALKPGTRPLASCHYVQPADGFLSQVGRVDDGWLVQAKGRFYTVRALLGGDESEAARFYQAASFTTYLSPRDYHRVHMPIAGTLRRTRYIPGDLFAVNLRTAAGVDQLYARNERLVCFFDTEDGEMVLVLVGAMIVAGISTIWDGAQTPGVASERVYTAEDAITLARGAELGRFYLGSTVVALLPRGELEWLAKEGDTVRVLAALADPSPSIVADAPADDLPGTAPASDAE